MLSALLRGATPNEFRTAVACLLFPALACCGQNATPLAAGALDADMEASADRDARAPRATADADLGDEDGTVSVDAEDAGMQDVDAASDEDTSPSSVADSGEEPFDAAVIDGTGACGAIAEQHPIEGANHVTVCSPVTYLTKPPSSGDHYPIWAAYQSYASAIPEGFWVHNLEHGAVVVSYNCAGGCAAEVAAAQSWIDALPSDTVCDPAAGDPRIRVVMTPDPNLDVRFAASAWGWTLRANCFDPNAFDAFFAAHYGQGPEALCAQGQDLSLGVQDGCGE